MDEETRLALAEKGAQKRKRERERKQAENRAACEIDAIPFDGINWKRRLKAKKDLIYAARTYLPDVFGLPPADYHYKLVELLKDVLYEQMKQAILLPRGGGKTMWSLFCAMAAMLFGLSKWTWFVAANELKSREAFDTVLTWLKSPLIQQDFPELVYPLSLIGTDENGSVAKSQTYNGFHTCPVMDRAKGVIHLPAVVLSEADAFMYQVQDPESVKFVSRNPEHPEIGVWIPAGAWDRFSACSINSSLLRGGNIQHPYTFESIRPALAIVDDIQNDTSAKNKNTCQKYEETIEGTIRYLAGAGNDIGIIMPCTVIESGDLADLYSDPEKKPDWRGFKVPMVTKWPEGMTNTEITNETETARMWQRYREEEIKSLRNNGNLKDATKFYRKYRAILDLGFEVSWKARYSKKFASAIQEAMHLRFENHKLFLSNCQQVGGDVLVDRAAHISARDFAEKQSECRKGFIPEKTVKVVSFIDVQRQYLVWVVCAFEADMTGVITDYGTWPDFGGQRIYRRRQANDWKLLTQKYLKEHPSESVIRNSAGEETLNITDMYRVEISNLIQYLLNRKWTRETSGIQLTISRIGVDSQEGIMAANARTLAKWFPFNVVVPYHGMGIRANRMGIDNTRKSTTVRYETDQNPSANMCRWLYKYNANSALYELFSDVNAWKDELFTRLETPPGQPGSITLYKAPPFEHELFARQVCESEIPTEMTALGVTRNLWNPVPDTDNEFLDCMTGCLCLASFEGCTYQTNPQILAPPTQPVAASGGSFRDRIREAKEKSGEERRWKR